MFYQMPTDPLPLAAHFRVLLPPDSTGEQSLRGGRLCNTVTLVKTSVSPRLFVNTKYHTKPDTGLFVSRSVYKSSYDRPRLAEDTASNTAPYGDSPK